MTHILSADQGLGCPARSQPGFGLPEWINVGVTCWGLIPCPARGQQGGWLRGLGPPPGDQAWTPPAGSGCPARRVRASPDWKMGKLGPRLPPARRVRVFSDQEIGALTPPGWGIRCLAGRVRASSNGEIGRLGP